MWCAMPRPVGTAVKRVTVTLPERQLKSLHAIASRENVSVAWLVRKAVDRMLRDGPEIPDVASKRTGRGGK